MKSKKKAWIFVVVVLMMIVTSATALKNVIAINNQDYRTTIIDSDGLEIEVANINSGEITDTEEYIKENINENYAKSEKLEAKDIILVKHLIAESSGFKGEKTIDAMYDESEDAFIMMNDYGTLLYDTDENSKYYVAYVNNLINDYSYTATDNCFAYTNLNGEVISDAIYDYNTGLAYVPKKYTEENKNGRGALNVQIELLQVTDTQTPKTTFNVKLDVQDELKGKFAKSGTATVESVATEFGLKIVLDEEAKSQIDSTWLSVKVNDNQTYEWEYYEKEGIIVLNYLPNNIETVEISVSKDNIKDNLDHIMNDGISSHIGSEDMEYYDFIGQWSIDPNNPPPVGVTWDVEADKNEGYNAQFVDIYYASRLNPGNLGVPIPLYNENTDMNWENLVSKVINGQDINIENMHKNDDWIQHQIRVNRELTTNGITIPAGTLIWLKCSHAKTSFEADWDRSPDYADGGDLREHSWKMKMRVLKISDDYMVMSIITTKLHNQAGAGIFKVRIAPSTGKIKVAKKDNHDKLLAGAKLGIWGPDGYYNEVLTIENDYVTIPDLKPGEYTVKEIEAPNNMVLNAYGNTVIVEPNSEKETIIEDNYQRGKATLTKYDERNTGDTQGDATLEGAEFNFCAATEIYEGPTIQYKANEVIRTVTTDANGNTETITDLPIGEYYYIETKAPEGFTVNTNRIPAVVQYTGQENAEATHAEVTCPDKPIYNDLVITKYRGETANTQKSPIAGAVFTARLDSNPAKEYVSTTTDENGYCIIKDMPYGHYTIEETTVPETTMKCSDFKLFVELDKSEFGPYTLNDVKFVDPENKLDTVGKQWLDENGNLVDEPEVMNIKIRKVDKDYWDVHQGAEKVDKAQGDAVLQGAIYQIYEWDDATNSYSEDPIKTIEVDHKDEDGYWCAEQNNLIVGRKYMVKEKVRYEETVKGKTYKYSFAEGYLVDETEFEFYQQPEAQTTKRTYHEALSKEEVQRGRVSIIKYNDNKDSSTESPAKGAIIRMALESNPDIYYTVKIDKDGFGEFVETNDDLHTTSVNPTYGAKYYPYTIPYGDYVLTEDKAADGSEGLAVFIDKEHREIKKQAQDVFNTIFADEPKEVWVKIVKNDADTKTNITKNPASFKIYDCTKKKMIEFMTTRGATETLMTNEYGYFVTPQKLITGEYILYEVDSPNGYYLDPKLKLPENEADIGNIEKGGRKINLNQVVQVKISDDNKPEDYVHTVVVENQPLKGQVEVVKTGEMLTGYKTEKVTGLDGKEYTVTKPVYEYKALEGVEYTLTAKEDIKTPDGVIWEAKGTKHKIETNSEGYAISEELYCGIYTVEETKTPLGFKTDKNIPDIVVTNTDKNERIKTISKEYKNQKMPTQIEVEKVLEKDEYDLSEDKIGVILGIYANEDIKNYNQTQTLIKKGTLLDVVEGKIQAGEKMTLTSNVNLPEGKYYVRELYVDYPYTVDVNDQGFEVKFDSTKTDKALIKGIVINNDIPVSASIGFIKLSTSFLTGDLNNSKIGGYLSDEELAKEQSLITEWVNNTPFDKVMAVLRGEEEAKNLDIARYRLDAKYKLSEATYELYKDKELTKPLTKNGKVVSFTTDESGVGKVDRLPLGEYYLKETKAPKLIYEGKEIEYEKELGEIKIQLSYNDENQNVARILFDDMASGIEIIKTDLFTSELVPNCRFEIRDSKDELIVDATTDDEGKFKMPIDLFTEGETYTYTEKEAPEMYDIDTTPHEFTLKLDEYGKPIPVKVDNIRKSKELRILKVDEETGEPLQGCVFSIALLDENGEPKIGEDGLPIYLVKDAVTDKNGEYLIKKAYYGTYKFTEVQAPKDYELTEKDMEGYVFTIDENSADRIDFVITNTGDIAVIALVGILMISAIGIIYTLRKKYNKQ